MSEFQRQHPAAALANAFEIIKSNFITILVLMFLGGGGKDANLTLYWIIGTVVCLLIYGFFSWLRFSYRVEKGELQIEQGVLIRKNIYLTADRIQVIDITAGIIQRIFGLVAVEVKTAGSSSKQARINAISREKADELKLLLRKQETPSELQEEEAEAHKVYTLSARDLLVAATTSGRLGVALSVVGAAFSQVEQFLTEDQLVRLLEYSMPASTSTAMVIMAILAIVAVSWLFAFISTIVKYYDFEVQVREKELLITRGLFERTQLTIPFNRIQAVQIREELLRQPLGYASLVIESAGYGEKQGNSTTLFPLIEKHKIFDFIAEVLPEYDVPINEQAHVNKTGMRRYLLRMVWITLPVIAFIWSSIPYGGYSWLLLIPALMLGYRQYRDAGIGYGDNSYIITSRLLSKTTAIIKKYRVQAAQMTQNPFQRRLALSNLTIHVASGNQGRSFTIRELSQQQANNYREKLGNEKELTQSNTSS